MAEPAEVTTSPPPRPARPNIGAAIAAAEAKQRRSLLRNHHGGHAPVTQLELFFDLVFVFAITQLSHFLLSHLTLIGALQTAALFGAVWWAWMWTTWATNWVHPGRGEVRVLIGFLMLASMVMAVAIPYGFAERAIAFAAAYCLLQVGRCLFVAWAMGREEPGAERNMLRAAIWFTTSAPLWIAGALIEDSAWQLTLWSFALALEYLGPAVFLWVPWLGRSNIDEWMVSGSHMAERCGLFIIIALGEGLLITGATYAGAKAQPGLDAALLTAFLGSFAMWWLYFDMGAERGAKHIETHALPGLIARQAFTYWHIPIVAGIVVLAVADELTLAHPLEPVHNDFLVILIVGAALFLGGLAGFKRISSGNSWFPASHVYGIYALAPLGLAGYYLHPPTLVMLLALNLLTVAVAVWEWGSFHGGWMERMESRGWWIAKVLRARIERRRAAREAKRGEKLG